MKELGRAGFSLAELLVSTVLLGFVLAGLHQAHLQQRRFTEWQQRIADAHDGYRVANAVFAAEFREAVIGDGDVTLFKPDSLAVRSPQGFGIVCAVRSSPPVFALSHATGVMPSLNGDSVLVHMDAGWRAMAVVASPRPGTLGLFCPFGTSRPDYLVRIEAGLADSISVGAPVRVYRPHRYHLLEESGRTWLARTDQQGTEALVGPLTADGLRFRLIDATGGEASAPADAVATELQLVFGRVGVTRAEVRDTLVMLFQGRNR